MPDLAPSIGVGNPMRQGTLNEFPYPIGLRQKQFSLGDPGTPGRAEERKKSALAVTVHDLLF